jgi:hypothetical protein
VVVLHCCIVVLHLLCCYSFWVLGGFGFGFVSFKNNMMMLKR